ncbi:MAG: peptidase [Phycisphaerae bacterium]
MHHRTMFFWPVVAAVLTCLLSGCSTLEPAPAKPEAVAAPAAAPGDAPWFRKPGSLDRDTIFSPIDLPPATPQRSAAGIPGHAYWQQRADYQINATLDAESNTITGVERITYYNRSPDELPYIWVQLDQNYFRDTSIGNLMREEGGRFGNRGGFEGGCELRSVRLLSSLAGELNELRSPAGSGDDAGKPSGDDPAAADTAAEPAEVRDLPHTVYDTMCRVDLPTPMEPATGRIVLEIEWSFRIPEYGADRLGIEPTQDGLIYQLAQWFPSIAVYDDVHGWNALGYLGQGEFYTNFGDFDVRLTVPRDHLVGATGVLVNPEEVLTAGQLERLNRAKSSQETVVIRGESEVTDAASRPAGDGPLTWRFIARDVRTFAWTSSKAFLWDAATIPQRGQSPADASADPRERPPPGTLVQSFYPREALPLWTRSTQMLKAAIEGYGRRWYEYPYPTAINVNGRAGGMEYPMIIFCRERQNDRGLFGVTTHEIGHNWFPMIVSTDEKRHAWMDEGFNSFINYYSNAEYWNQPPGGRGDAAAFAQTMLEPEQQPMDTPADRIRDGRLGTLQYAKPATMLVLLREVVLGPDRFDAAFRQYIRAWAFKSPRPADFIRCMENGAGADLAWFWRGWIYGTGTLDQAVTSAEFVESSQHCRVVFENKGELVMPLTYRVTYHDGSSEDRLVPVEAWYTRTTFTASWDSKGKEPSKVEIDPESRLPDTERENNIWALDAGRAQSDATK